MNDQEIKELLTSYVREEMELLKEEEMPGYDIVYSKSYHRRIRRMFWSEKYFGCHIYLGYMVRRAAIVAIIMLSLLTANEVSARVFGFNPWKTIQSFWSDSKMEVKTYREPVEPPEDVSLAVPTKEIPTNIPEDFKQVEYIPDNHGVYVVWQKSDTVGIQYSKDEILEGMVSATDGEYESKERIEIAGFAGEYCVKGDEAWISWDDISDSYLIVGTGIDHPKDLLLDLAENLYE